MSIQCLGASGLLNIVQIRCLLFLRNHPIVNNVISAIKVDLKICREMKEKGTFCRNIVNILGPLIGVCPP